MSAEGYYIIAHCVNAVSYDRAEVVLDVASESTDGAWWTTDGREVWPFWKQPIEFETPPIPEGWIEHLHDIARRVLPPRIDLAEALGLRKSAHTPPPLPRRL